MYIARNHAIQVPFQLRTKTKRVDQKALLDCGATECFIHPRVVERLKLITRKLVKPQKVQNVDGSPNKSGEILEAIDLLVNNNGQKASHSFFVANIGRDDFILGYPFFEASNPNVDWSGGRIEGFTTILSTNADTWRPPLKGTRRQDSTPAWVRCIPGWEEGDEIWLQTRVAKTTVAQQLAEAATDKRKRTWQEIVPERYHRHGKVFSEKASERFPDRRPWDHAIELKDDAPTSINCQVYPLSPKEKEEQREFLSQNLHLQRIRRSKSPYASGFFLIRKKDGKFRPVQDYRNLNKWTIPNKYPLPLISELIYDLAEKRLFLKFDIRWGYNNIRIKEGDEYKAAFKTSEGLFEPTVMFFRLTNSPATFQTMMDDIFQEEVAQGWLRIYMDDMIIATEDDEVLHELRVNHILDKLEKFDLFLKPEKCRFHQCEVEYLGVLIGNGSVKMDPVKVQGISEWPTPQTVKDVRSFLGFCNFYRAFIKNFSDIARPLNDLTRKDEQFIWTTERNAAFLRLKEVCCSYPVLRTPDWSKQFVMETDASGYALGVVIAQEFEDGIHPIAFHSRSLLPAERNYDAHDKELAAVIFGFKCGRPLFLGATHAICVRTDHKNLQYFRNPRKITGRQARWIEFLQDFNYTLEHIPGSANTVADLLSRRKDLNKGVDSNEPRILLPDHLFAPTNPAEVHKIFLKDDPDLCRDILQTLHDSPAAGHLGISNTWELVREQYEGPRLREFVEQYVKGCARCQESKTNVHRSKAPLQRFDTPVEQGPFQYVSMDLITDLPKSQGFDSILTIVDQGCSKAAKFIPCIKTIDGTEVALEYLKHLVPWFGLPKRIISDRDPWFTSAFAKEMCKALGIQQNLSTAFHPRTDGQTERMNAWIEQYLRPWTSGRPSAWSQLLPVAEFAHNSWKHDVARKSPHELLIGIKPQVILKHLEGPVPAAETRLRLLEESRQLAQKLLQNVQSRKDNKRLMEIKEGDQVWLEGRNLSIAGNRKLSPKRYGPFKVSQRISPVAMQLDLPKSMKIHNVFHTDLLLPYKETEQYGTPYTHPPPIIDSEEEYEIENILDAQRFGKKCKLQYLVHWKGYPHSDDQWVDHKDLNAPDVLADFYLTNSATAGRPTV